MERAQGVSRSTPSMVAAALLAAAPCLAQPALELEVLRTVRLPEGGAEIVAVSPDGKRAAVTQARSRLVRIVKLPSGEEAAAGPIDVGSLGEPTSVAFAGRRTLLAVVKADPDPGALVVADAGSGEIIATAPLGIGPDSIAVARERRVAVVAIEDEEAAVEDPTRCPPENVRPGAIQLVDFSRGLTSRDLRVATVPVDLGRAPGVSCPADPQPEYVAIAPGGAKAYVTLQENNAIAVVDLRSESVERVFPAGTTTHLADTEPDSAFRPDREITARREPDGIAVSPDGRLLFTADEGDTGTSAGGVLSGGRTLSVWDAATGRLLADTADAIERTVAAHGRHDDGRSGRRGPEPEGVVAFELAGRRYAAVALERAASVVVFDVTNPSRPTVAGLAPVGREPEGIAYVPWRRLLVTADEAAGTLTLIRVSPR